MKPVTPVIRLVLVSNGEEGRSITIIIGMWKLTAHPFLMINVIMT